MAKLVNLLVASAPDWVTIRRESDNVHIEVELPKPNGGIWPTVHLQLSVFGTEILLREFPASRWPQFCPQRHINEGGYFCLGLSDVPTVMDGVSATAWWNVVYHHLQTQFVADRTSRWPPHQEWSHGQAGETQMEMERLASQKGWLTEVQEAHFYNVGWLSGDIPRISKYGERLVNGRARCPRGCIRRSKPILRRKCRQREAVFKLVQLEHRRRDQEIEFWKLKKHKECCGRMINCPLATQI